MRFEYRPKFKRAFRRFSQQTQERFYKQADHLLQDLRHPSLRAKKFDEARGIWQARVDRDVRFYFLIEDDAYILLDIRHHPK